MYVCYGDCAGMDNHTVMAVQSLLESQNVQEALQGYFSSVMFTLGSVTVVIFTVGAFCKPVFTYNLYYVIASVCLSVRLLAGLLEKFRSNLRCVIMDKHINV